MKQLSAKFVKTVAEPGRFYDGDAGLFLLVKPSGRKSYVQRLTIRGKRHDIGLGSTRWTSLTDARAVAQANRKVARTGGDPLAARRADVPNFAEAVETVIGIHREGWKDAGKSEKQWRASLRDYAMPRLGRRRIDQITAADVMAVLLPIWHEKHETARRVRQRISTTMKWAVAQGYRGDNPAGDAISAALPKNGAVRQHQRALPFAEVGEALDKVKASNAYPTTRLAFEFLVLTACRAGEVRLATWNEVDLELGAWTVPARRMKAKRDHRVPLPGRAFEILAEARQLADGEALDKVKASNAYPTTRLAFEFLVLTACRAGEVRLATWNEVDLELGAWTVPARRMKAKRDHRVPLPGRAFEILAEARQLAEIGGHQAVY